MQDTATGELELRPFAVLYSYPTWDPHYRGQRGVRVMATDEADALARIRSGAAGYGRVPGARIVRIEEKAPRLAELEAALPTTEAGLVDLIASERESGRAFGPLAELCRDRLALLTSRPC